MEASQGYFLLKILSGPHQGAEIILNDGNLTVGSDPECDLILSDVFVAPKHFELHISNQKIGLTPLDQNVFIQGKMVQGKTIPVESFNFITVGTTQIVIGPKNEKWPPLKAADAPKIEEAVEAAENQVVEKPELTRLQKMIQKVSPTLSEKLNARYSQRVQRGILILMAILLSVCLYFFAVYIINPSTPPLPTAEEINAPILDEIQNLDLVSGLKINQNDNRISIRGYVDTTEKKIKIYKLAQKIQGSVFVEVWSQAELVASAGEMLVMLQLSLGVASGAPGVVQVNGYVQDIKAWHEIKESIFRDIHGLKGINDNVATGQDVLRRAKPILVEHQLVNQITIIPKPKFVLIQGVISEESVQEWLTIKQQIFGSFGPLVPIRDEVKTASNAILEDIYFDNTIESITISDGMAWLTLKSGHLYFQGASLESGYVIERIHQSGVTLRKGGSRVSLKIGDRLWTNIKG